MLKLTCDVKQFLLQSRAVASGGPVVPGPQFKIGAPHFMFDAGCCIYPIFYLKMCPLVLVGPPAANSW